MSKHNKHKKKLSGNNKLNDSSKQKLKWLRFIESPEQLIEASKEKDSHGRSKRLRISGYITFEKINRLWKENKIDYDHLEKFFVSDLMTLQYFKQQVSLEYITPDDGSITGIYLLRDGKLYKSNLGVSGFRDTDLSYYKMKQLEKAETIIVNWANQ